jgi:hypothetical protein
MFPLEGITNNDSSSAEPDTPLLFRHEKRPS